MAVASSFATAPLPQAQRRALTCASRQPSRPGLAAVPVPRRAPGARSVARRAVAGDRSPLSRFRQAGSFRARRVAAGPAKASGESADPVEGAVVSVFGASGRVGSLVVRRLLERGAEVRAVVRSKEKAAEVLPVGDDGLILMVCDLRDKAAVNAALKGADAAIWCVALDENRPSPVEILKGLLKIGTPKASVDVISEQLIELGTGAPLVLLSSAAVTRPAWSGEKKQRLEKVVDIPIVRLNPFGTLDRQREQEQRLRESGVPYSVVRPTGLSSDWPAGRPVLSQGDVAVGRANKQDVADVLIAAAFNEEAHGKTFEMITLQGYSPPRDRFDAVFSRLFSDEEREAAGEDVGFGAVEADTPGEMAATAQYNMMMQLLPGEIQDPTKLEMGKKYEQVDSGEVNRKKGAAPTTREKRLAAGIRV